MSHLWQLVVQILQDIVQMLEIILWLQLLIIDKLNHGMEILIFK